MLHMFIYFSWEKTLLRFTANNAKNHSTEDSIRQSRPSPQDFLCFTKNFPLISSGGLILCAPSIVEPALFVLNHMDHICSRFSKTGKPNS